MIKFTCTDTKIIKSGTWYPDRAIFSADGRILCTYEQNGEKATNLYSPDGGKSWQETDDVMGRFHFAILSDGSVLGLSVHNEVNDKIPTNQRKKPYIMGTRRANDFDALLKGDFEDDFIKAEIPSLSVGNGDDGKGYCGVCDHGIVELPNGDILATMYGFFHEDRTPVTVIKKMNYKYRTWTVISHDRGKSFEFLSSVADAQTYSELSVAEGFCEPDVIRLQSGNLLCVMRSGGQRGKAYFTPMYSSISTDNGKTWTAPAYVFEHGVFPKVLQLQSGAVIVSAGREGVFFCASEDDGKTWQEPVYISKNFASERGHFWNCPTGYTCIKEIAPGEILVIYDDIDETKKYPEPQRPERDDDLSGLP